MKIRLVLLVLAVAAAAGIAAFVFHSRSERPSVEESSQGESITIEMRAMPTATIRIDGKSVGRTPLNLHFARSDRQIEVEATLIRHLVGKHGTKDEVYKDVRTITLDRSHILDFTFKTAKLVETRESPFAR